MVAQCSPIGWRLWMLWILSIWKKCQLIQYSPWFKIPQPFPSLSVPFSRFQPGRCPARICSRRFCNISINCSTMYIEESSKVLFFWLETATLRDLLNLCPLDAAGRLRGCECLLGSPWRFPHNCVRKGEAQGISISQSDACHRANMANPTTSSVVEDVLTTCCFLFFKREIAVFKQIKKALGFVKWEAILEGYSTCCLMLPP